MKKIILSAICLSMLVGCSDNSYDGPKNSATTYSVVGTVFIPENESVSPYFTPESEYKFLQYTDDNTCEVSCESVVLPNLSRISFKSPKLTAFANSAELNLNYPGSFFGAPDVTMEDFTCFLTQRYYSYVSATDYTYISERPTLGQFAFISYKIQNQGTVKTFPRSAFFSGETTTKFTMGGVEQTFSTRKPLYNVVMDLANRKATVVLYNVQFAPQMPAQVRMEISGLTITPDRESGYVIEGKGLIPVCGVGAGAVEYKDFAFDNIKICPVNNRLSKVSIEFTVAGRFSGSFTGSCLVD